MKSKNCGFEKKHKNEVAAHRVVGVSHNVVF
jgi:hypothetical protein